MSWSSAGSSRNSFYAKGCLTANEVKAVEQIYRDPVDPKTGKVIFPGPVKSSEDGFSADGKAFPVALDLFRSAAFQNPA